jgi:ribose/xylose/arabinose/galactoside ABC-type transport system permease subunit
MSQATAGHPPAGRTGCGPARPARLGDRAHWSRYTQQAGLIACVVVLAAVFAARNGTFLSSSNLIELLRSATLYFIVACASTLVLVGGGLAVVPAGHVDTVTTIGRLTAAPA